jgi:biotin operon repressor
MGKQDRLLKLLKDPTGLKDIKTELDYSSHNKIKKDINQLVAQGYDIKLKDKMYYLNKSPIEHIEAVPIECDEFALISDTHLGSKVDRVDLLEEFYDEVKDRGIKQVFHSGDIGEGIGDVYKGQINDIKVVGLDNLMEYIIENYPQRKDITTNFIIGNHDSRVFDKDGIDIGKILDANRKDLNYLGIYYARIDLGDDILLDIVHPSGSSPYCYSKDTEVLTKEGWLLFKDLTKKHYVATRTKDGFLVWNKPTKIFKFDYCGELINVKSKSFNLLVTPNHKLFVRRYPNDIIAKRKDKLAYPKKSHGQVDLSWSLQKTEHICDNFRRQKWQLNKEVKWEGTEVKEYNIPYRKKRKFASFEPKHFGTVNMDLFLQFLGWYVSEGCGDNSKVIITQSKNVNPKKYNEICGLLDKLNWNYSKHGYKSIVIYGKELEEHLHEICGNGAKNKKVPRFIKDLTPRQIWLFLETALKGDGTKDKQTNKWTSYATISKTLKNDMQELFLKCGIGAIIGPRDISLANEQNLPTINTKPIKVKYDGIVYCCEVENHVILVRRKGRPIWCGNSIGYPAQKYLRAAPPSTQSDIYSFGHRHQSMFVSYNDVYMFEAGCWSGTTDFLRRKGITSIIGGWINEIDKEDGEITRFRPEWITYKQANLQKGL